jgi:hypothetical protein
MFSDQVLNSSLDAFFQFQSVNKDADKDNNSLFEFSNTGVVRISHRAKLANQLQV